MDDVEIHYTNHAREKFSILARHGFLVTVQQVAATVLHPDLVEVQKGDKLIAQKRMSERHVLRVVYRLEETTIVVITFYPGYRERYERQV